MLLQPGAREKAEKVAGLAGSGKEMEMVGKEKEVGKEVKAAAVVAAVGQ